MARDPAMELQLLLFSTGVVKSPGKKSIIYPWIVGFTYLNLVADTLISIYLIEDHPFNDKIETIQCTISLVHLVGKIFNLKFRSKTFWRLINDTREIWKEMAQQNGNITIFEELSDQIRIIVVGVLFVSLVPVPISVLLSLMRNLGMDSDKWEPIYKNWDPIRDSLGEDWYWTRSAYQIVIMAYALFLFVAVYCAIILPCLVAGGLMRVLIRMLESDDVNVLACVKLHQRILKYVGDINNLFSGQMFLDMVLSTLYIAFRSYQIIEMFNNNDARVFGALFFVVVCFGAPFLVCCCGHIIADMSEQVHRSAAQGQWYKLPETDRKSLCFLMMRTATPLCLQYHNLMRFNMAQYATMVQGTYSFITLLTGVTA